MRIKLFLSLFLAVSLTSTGCTSNDTDTTSTSQQQEQNDKANVTSAQPAPAQQVAGPQTTQQAVVGVNSAKMGRAINITVTLPQQYLTQGDNTRYPVLYLLHGYGDTNASWPEKYDLKTAATKYGAIIVCPDGQNSWYLDSPIDTKMQFETFVSNELVTYIDSNYRTRANRQGRAITGLSMGGHGALFLAFRHADVFGSCGAMSGGVDITKFPNRWALDKRLGKYSQNQKLWAQHSVINQLDSIKPGDLNIIIDDGRQDFFYEVNMALHSELDKRGIKHDFTIRPGNHSWKYWCVSLPAHLDFFAQAWAGKKVDCKVKIDNSPAPQDTNAKDKTGNKKPQPEAKAANENKAKAKTTKKTSKKK